MLLEYREDEDSESQSETNSEQRGAKVLADLCTSDPDGGEEECALPEEQQEPVAEPTKKEEPKGKPTGSSSVTYSRKEIATSVQQIFLDLPEEFAKKAIQNSEFNFQRAGSELRSPIGYGPDARIIFNAYMQYECQRALEIAKHLKERGLAITGFPGEEKDGKLHPALADFDPKSKPGAKTLQKLVEMKAWNEAKEQELAGLHHSYEMLSGESEISDFIKIIEGSKEDEKYGGRIPELWLPSEKVTDSSPTLATSDQQERYKQIARDWLEVEEARHLLKAADTIHRATISGYEGNNLSLALAGSSSFLQRLDLKRDFPGEIVFGLDGSIISARLDYPERIPEDGRVIGADVKKIEAIKALAARIREPVHQAVREAQRGEQIPGWRCSRGTVRLPKSQQDSLGQPFNGVRSWFDAEPMQIRTFAADGTVHDEERIKVVSTKQNVQIGLLSYHKHGDVQDVGEPMVTGEKGKAQLAIESKDSPSKSIQLAQNEENAVGGAQIKLSSFGMVQVRTFEGAPDVLVRKPNGATYQLKAEHGWIDLDTDDQILTAGNTVKVDNSLRLYKPGEQVSIEDSSGHHGEMAAADLAMWGNETTTWQIAGDLGSFALDVSFLYGGVTRFAALKAAEKLGIMGVARRAFTSSEGRGALKDLLLGGTGLAEGVLPEDVNKVRGFILQGDIIGGTVFRKTPLNKTVFRSAFDWLAAEHKGEAVGALAKTMGMLGKVGMAEVQSHILFRNLPIEYPTLAHRQQIAKDKQGFLGAGEMLAPWMDKKPTREGGALLAQTTEGSLSTSPVKQTVQDSSDLYNDLVKPLELTTDPNQRNGGRYKELVGGTRQVLLSPASEEARQKQRQELIDRFAIASNSIGSEYDPREGMLAAIGLITLAQKPGEPFPAELGKQSKDAALGKAPVLSAQDLASFLEKQLSESNYLEMRLTASNLLRAMGRRTDRQTAGTLVEVLGQEAWREEQINQGTGDGWTGGSKKPFVLDDLKAAALVNPGQYSLAKYYQQCCATDAKEDAAIVLSVLTATIEDPKTKPHIKALAYSILEMGEKVAANPAQAESLLQELEQTWHNALQESAQDRKDALELGLDRSYVGINTFTKQTFERLLQPLLNQPEKLSEAQLQQLAAAALRTQAFGGSLLTSRPDIQQAIYSTLLKTIAADQTKISPALMQKAFSVLSEHKSSLKPEEVSQLQDRAVKLITSTKLDNGGDPNENNNNLKLAQYCLFMLSENLADLKEDQLAKLRQSAVDIMGSVKLTDTNAGSWSFVHQLLSDNSADLQNLFKAASPEELTKLKTALQSFVKTNSNLQEMVGHTLAANRPRDELAVLRERMTHLAVKELSRLTQSEQMVQAAYNPIDFYNNLVRPLELTTDDTFTKYSLFYKRLVNVTRTALATPTSEEGRQKQRQELVDSFIEYTNSPADNRSDGVRSRNAMLAAAGLVSLVQRLDKPFPDELGEASADPVLGEKIPLKTDDVVAFLEVQSRESDYLEMRLTASNLLYAMGRRTARECATTFLEVVTHPSWREKQAIQEAAGRLGEGKQKPFALDDIKLMAMVNPGQFSLARYYQECCELGLKEDAETIKKVLVDIMQSKKERGQDPTQSPYMRALAYSLLDMGEKITTDPSQAATALRDLEQTAQLAFTEKPEDMREARQDGLRRSHVSLYAFARKTVKQLTTELSKDASNSDELQKQAKLALFADSIGGNFLSYMPESEQLVLSTLLKTVAEGPNKIDPQVVHEAFSALSKDLSKLKPDELNKLRQSVTALISSSDASKTPELMQTLMNGGIQQLFASCNPEEKENLTKAVQSFLNTNADILEDLNKQLAVDNKEEKIAVLNESVKSAINNLVWLTRDSNNRDEFIKSLTHLADASTSSSAGVRAAAVSTLLSLGAGLTDQAPAVDYRQLLAAETDPQIKAQLASFIDLQADRQTSHGLARSGIDMRVDMNDVKQYFPTECYLIEWPSKERFAALGKLAKQNTPEGQKARVALAKIYFTGASYFEPRIRNDALNLTADTMRDVYTTGSGEAKKGLVPIVMASLTTNAPTPRDILEKQIKLAEQMTINGDMAEKDFVASVMTTLRHQLRIMPKEVTAADFRASQNLQLLAMDVLSRHAKSISQDDIPLLQAIAQEKHKSSLARTSGGQILAVQHPQSTAERKVGIERTTGAGLDSLGHDAFTLDDISLFSDPASQSRDRPRLTYTWTGANGQKRTWKEDKTQKGVFLEVVDMPPDPHQAHKQSDRERNPSKITLSDNGDFTVAEIAADGKTTTFTRSGAVIERQRSEGKGSNGAREKVTMTYSDGSTISQTLIGRNHTAAKIDAKEGSPLAALAVDPHERKGEVIDRDINIDPVTGAVKLYDLIPIVDAQKTARRDRTPAMERHADNRPTEKRLIVTVNADGSLVYPAGQTSPAALAAVLPGLDDTSNHRMPAVRQAAQGVLNKLGQSALETADYGSFNNDTFVGEVMADAHKAFGQSTVRDGDNLKEVCSKLYKEAMSDNAKVAQYARKRLALLGMRSVEAAEAIGEFCRNRGPGTADFASLLPLYLTDMPGMDASVRRVHFRTLASLADNSGSLSGNIPQAQVARLAQQALDWQSRNMPTRSDTHGPYNSNMLYAAELMEYLYQSHAPVDRHLVQAFCDMSAKDSQTRVAAERLLSMQTRQPTTNQLSFAKPNIPSLPGLILVSPGTQKTNSK